MALIIGPKSLEASPSKTELKPTTPARSPHDQQSSNTRFDNNSVGRPPKDVKRIYGDFEYRAASWDKPRRVVAKVEWHLGELFPRVGFIVTNQPMEPDWMIRFYNQRGTAEQQIKQGRQAINWARLSRKGMAQNLALITI